MNELLNDTKLTTSDIVDPPRNPPVQPIRTARQNYTDATDPPNVTPAPTEDVVAAASEKPVSAVEVQPPSPNSSSPLFPEDELHNFRAQWDHVQTSFVDEPRKAVEQADSLVANVVKRIAERFAFEREELEKRWDRGDSVNTEDLRQALKLYRAFFDRLLTF